MPNRALLAAGHTVPRSSARIRRRYCRQSLFASRPLAGLLPRAAQRSQHHGRSDHPIETRGRTSTSLARAAPRIEPDGFSSRQRYYCRRFRSDGVGRTCLAPIVCLIRSDRIGLRAAWLHKADGFAPARKPRARSTLFSLVACGALQFGEMVPQTRHERRQRGQFLFGKFFKAVRFDRS